MDRCHHIRQQRPVLVLRLATTHSVEGKMLARARSKLALERLVIKKGAFKEMADIASAAAEGSDASANTGLSAAELLDLLKGTGSAGDDTVESGEVDDAMLDKLLDRKHLEQSSCGKSAELPYPLVGVGYCVDMHEDSKGGMLSSINK